MNDINELKKEEKQNEIKKMNLEGSASSPRLPMINKNNTN